MDILKKYKYTGALATQPETYHMFKAVWLTPSVLVTADINIKVPVNLNLKPRRHTDTYFDTPDVTNDSFVM